MNVDLYIEQGSGNVFADLDYPNAEDALIKARLAQRITEVLYGFHMMSIHSYMLRLRCCRSYAQHER